MFRLSILSSDLRHEETVIQAAIALDRLQQTVNLVFRQIDDRIERNRSKIVELDQRVKRARTTICNLFGVQKAISIYAPPRFPATLVFHDIPSTFPSHSNCKSMLNDSLNGQKEKQEYQIKSTLDSGTKNLNEKLVFFHVKSTELPTNSVCVSLSEERLQVTKNTNFQAMARCHLIQIPTQLNTDFQTNNKNLGLNNQDSWKQTKIFKNKCRVLPIKCSSNDKQILDSPPPSLICRNKKQTPADGLRYTPSLKDAPGLNVPLDLPDLPGIANDLHYEEQEAKEQIAPSLSLIIENLPDLPELMSKHVQDVSYKLTVSTKLEKEISKTLTVLPPPPPPPPKTTLPNLLSTKTENIPKYETTDNQQIGVIDSRSELMEAIRNFGGVDKSRLRHIPKNSIKNDNISQSSIQQTPNWEQQNYLNINADLMTDLRNKLLMRRRGISGSKQNSANKILMNIHENTNYSQHVINDTSVASKLSAMIPPPKVNSSDEEDDTNSNDTDWND